MLHPSDTDRLEQLEKELRDLQDRFDRLAAFVGMPEDRPTLPAPPPADSDPPKTYCACSSPGCDLCHP